MNKRFLTLLLLCSFCVAGLFAQGRKGVCINEVMVQNDSNYVDDYGMRHAWVELFNSTFGSVNISSMWHNPHRRGNRPCDTACRRFVRPQGRRTKG